MGWFGDLLGGAAQGLIGSGGNPLGAALGAGASLLGSGSGGRTESTMPALRPWSPSEAAIMANLEKSLAGFSTMTPEMRAKQEETLYSQTFKPMQKSIEDAWLVAGGKIDAANLRRGGGQSSKMKADQLAVKAGMASDVASASANARMAARNSVLNEAASARADQAALAAMMDTLWKNRLSSSGVNRIAPDTSGYDAARMIGTNLGDKDSWLSKSLPSAWQGIKGLLGGGMSSEQGDVLEGLTKMGKFF